MSNTEKFGLFSGILGVIVDLGTIIGYISGLIKFDANNLDSPTHTEMPLLFILLLAGIIIYSWISISWSLSLRTIRYTKTKGIKFNLSRVTERTVLGVGLIIVPIILGWCVVVAQSSASNSTGHNRPKAIIYATQTAQAMLVPAVATRITMTEQAGGDVVIAESVDAIEEKLNNPELPTSFFVFMIFPVGSILLGLTISVILEQLLPIVHVEILEESDISWADESATDNDENNN